MEIREKYQLLQDAIRPLGRVLVAFSGGVDSSLLLRVCCDVLGRGNALALVGASPTYPERELEGAKELARHMGAEYLVVDTSEMEDAAFLANSRDRCYHCKSNLFSIAWREAGERSIQHVLEGSNLDDLKDVRPGRRACTEKGVKSPLLDAGLTKADIRQLSKELGLPTHDKPALACLSSRIPYGTPIQVDALRQIERAEEIVRATGVRQVRVRHHGAVARIEVPPEEIDIVMDHRDEIAEALKGIGFIYVALDLAGYRTGSMNLQSVEPLS